MSVYKARRKGLDKRKAAWQNVDRCIADMVVTFRVVCCKCVWQDAYYGN